MMKAETERRASIKTGILGGTFDPVHNGHLHIGNAALQAFHLDELWVMPNGKPPHKKSGSITATVEERLEMLRLAIRDYDGFKLCTYEAERKAVSYSYETMEYFAHRFPEREFFFIIGGDSLDMIAAWKNPERLMNCCTILVAVRNQKSPDETQKQIDAVAKQFHADIRLLRVSEFAVSSSEIRSWIQNGVPRCELEKYIPESVVRYIAEHHLYK